MPASSTITDDTLWWYHHFSSFYFYLLVLLKSIIRAFSSTAMLRVDPSPEDAMDEQDNLSFTARLALARVQESNKSFPFEKLPPELRNRIYDYVLTNEESQFPMHLRSGPHGLQYGLKPRSRSRACFSMLFLNKAINLEASSILYSTNNFDFNMSWLRSGGTYFERDIRSVSAFFSGLISTVQYIRKVQVLCDARTLIAPAWADLCRYLDTQLHLHEFILKIDLHGTYKPLRGAKPVPLLVLNYLLLKSLRYFESLQKPVFRCTSTPFICREWPCPLDSSLERELDAKFRDYLGKTGSTTLW